MVVQFIDQHHACGFAGDRLIQLWIQHAHPPGNVSHQANDGTLAITQVFKSSRLTAGFSGVYPFHQQALLPKVVFQTLDTLDGSGQCLIDQCQFIILNTVKGCA